MKWNRIVMIAVLCVTITGALFAEDSNPANYPEGFVPFIGDWVGKYVVGEEKHPDVAAQVIALGNDEYQIVLSPKLYARTPVMLDIVGKLSDGTVKYDDGYNWGEINEDVFWGGKRDEDTSTFHLTPYKLESPTLGAKPSKRAIVLFDGSGFDEWARFPKGTSWDILEGGILQASPKLGSIETARKFKSCRLHLEFRLPLLPDQRGQGRGNSGVFLQNFYEVQVLDSYGLPGYWNECGAIYQISAPYVNMCLPPLQWQTYDIEFHAAKFDRNGNLIENARMTVVHNGTIVQKDQEIPHGTSYDGKKPPCPPVKGAQPIHLQAHNNCVQYRNIWIERL
jgi:hypothetical protein